LIILKIPSKESKPAGINNQSILELYLASSIENVPIKMSCNIK
jgi:hypothetical protein